MIVDILSSDGYRILEADSGRRALELANANPIDAFLLDIEMPGQSGVEICRALRAIPQYRITPIIFVTAVAEHVGTAPAFAAGCDDLISKPLSPIVLRARLRGHMQRMEYFREMERTRRTLNRYISRRTLEVVDASSKTGVPPAPQERRLAILFTDIRDFTALSEEMDSAFLFESVSALLARQVDLVHAHGGYIDKFGGDGVMAIFDGPDMVVESCLCALRIVESSHNSGRSLWRSGVGIHTGSAVIGSIGSPDHLDYSVIGPAVNLAARLCGHAAAASIVVSKAVRDAANGDPRLRFHSERLVSIRGMKEPVLVYALSDAASDPLETLAALPLGNHMLDKSPKCGRQSPISSLAEAQIKPQSYIQDPPSAGKPESRGCRKDARAVP